MSLTLSLLAQEFIEYSEVYNSVTVAKSTLVSDYIGTHNVTVVSEYVDPKGRYHKFEREFLLEVTPRPEPEITHFDEESG